MRFPVIAATIVTSLPALGESSASGLWEELKAKREALSTLHQEFEVSQTYKSANHSQSSTRQVILDMFHRKWRERALAGYGNRTRIFDGENLFLTEDGESEYVRAKNPAKDGDPLPAPYGSGDPEWPKAKEMERRPCGLPEQDHVCVVLEAPLRRWTRSRSNSILRMLEGSARLIIDTETGALLSYRTIESIAGERSRYQSDTAYVLKLMSYGGPPDEKLFQLPAGDMREVKAFSPWNAARIKKHLAGKPAPELAVMDLEGKPFRLSSFKGKTVLLDFWTTWCPPCRADAPALDKLYQKYGEKNLVMIGISVSEERKVVEKFLSQYPHGFQVALTTENEMPRPYQIAVYPTYIVVDSDGMLEAAVEGDQGFGNLRKLLKRVGLEVE